MSTTTPTKLARESDSGRRRLPGRGKRAKVQDAEPEVAPGHIELPEPRGAIRHAKPRRTKRGGYGPLAPAAPTTTRAARILNPALIAAATDDEGVLIGTDMLSNLPVAHDPFTAYEYGRITSPNVSVLGVIGSAKSSLIKCVYVLRPLMLRKRRAVLIDKKDQNGRGEYSNLTEQMDGAWLPMVTGSDNNGTVINPFDPAILRGGGIDGQRRLLRAMLENGSNRTLDDWERKALRLAHAQTLRTAEARNVVPVLPYLVPNLSDFQPSDLADMSPSAKERLHQAGLSVRFMVEEIFEELEGLFDGETSKNVRLDDRLTSFDVSQLPETGPATAMVVAVANAWLMGMLRRDRGWRTNFVAEEGWALVDGPSGQLFKQNSKLARGLGLSNIAALHRPGDIAPGSPGEAMLKESQTVHIFRQERADDVDATIRMFGLSEGSRDLLTKLEQGHHLLKIGSRREIHVKHVRSNFEMGVTDTDTAMLGGRETKNQGRAA